MKSLAVHLGENSMEPHVYRPGKGWVIFGVGFGVACALLAAVLVATASGNFIAYPLAATALYMGFCAAANTIKSRVVLYPDAIEVSNFFRSQRFTRDEIGAKSFINVRLPTYFLYPWSKDVKKLKVEVAFPQDSIFQEWMASIPDADKAFLRGRRNGTLKPQNSN